jgi:alkanesulfonate monooxygenase SsuD/methylene tetrahydromethanopterin reductase-like flavin-dependent oxidoreductase (luciferase family)
MTLAKSPTPLPHSSSVDGKGARIRECLNVVQKAWQEIERTEPPVTMPLMCVVYVAPQAHTARQEAEAGPMHTCGRYRRWDLLLNVGTDYTTMARDRFIIGDPAQVIEEIQRYREIFGITYLICRMAIPAVPHDHIVRSMHLFSERVCTTLKLRVLSNAGCKRTLQLQMKSR